MHIDVARQRARAAALADALKPLIATHLAETEPPPPPPPPRPRPLDRRLLEACRGIASALDRFEQAKFTPQEIPARRAVLSAAQKLRSALRKREDGK